MRRLAGLALAFALLVVGIESLRVVVDWWQGGQPAVGWREVAAIAALAGVAVVWWRHSVFSCQRSCLTPEQPPEGPPQA